MRIFTGLKQAVNEVERDLGEMGTVVHPESYQDQVVKGNDDFITKELQGYSYKITKHDKLLDEFKELGGNEAYVLDEVSDRLSGKALNPGNSYVHRLEVWEEFLHHGKFAYTYSERISKQLDLIMFQLTKNPNTRQAVITLYNEDDDLCNMGGKARIPCSMYYQFLRRVRAGIEFLDVIYTMRSCDFYTHFIYDVTMTMLMQQWIAGILECQPGHFTHFMGSLHAYKKDYSKKEVF